jgi:hypothetical protein
MGRNSDLGCNEDPSPHHNIALGIVTDYPAGNLYRPDGRFRLGSFTIHGFTGETVKNKK